MFNTNMIHLLKEVNFTNHRVGQVFFFLSTDYGYACNTWLDCGNSDRYDCINRTCTCERGYRYANTTCTKGMTPNL